MGLLVNCHISLIFSKYCHINYCYIFKFLKKIVIFKLSYKNMTIFANCHIFLKIVIFPKYDKKKKPMHPTRTQKIFPSLTPQLQNICWWLHGIQPCRVCRSSLEAFVVWEGWGGGVAGGLAGWGCVAGCGDRSLERGWGTGLQGVGCRWFPETDFSFLVQEAFSRS